MSLNKRAHASLSTAELNPHFKPIKKNKNYCMQQAIPNTDITIHIYLVISFEVCRLSKTVACLLNSAALRFDLIVDRMHAFRCKYSRAESDIAELGRNSFFMKCVLTISTSLVGTANPVYTLNCRPINHETRDNSTSVYWHSLAAQAAKNWSF